MDREAMLKKANKIIAQDKYLSWGMDGYGVKHYDCRFCGKYFGPVDPDTIDHVCQKDKR